MGSLKEVRNRIVSVKSTQQITRAMKVVSASKLRKAQGRIIQMRPYAIKLAGMLSQLSGSLEGTDAAKYYTVKPVKKVLVIVVTSDRGLAGSFNGSIAKETVRLLNGKYGSQFKAGNVDIIPVGKKARDYFQKAKASMPEEHTAIFQDLTYEAAEDIAKRAIDAFLEGKYDAIDIVYNQFKNAAVFIPTVEQFLPIPTPEVKEGEKKKSRIEYIFEPSQEAIVTKLIAQSLKVSFFRTLLESNAAEHGARMTAMDKATENAEDLLKALKLQYNKERQATITKEILEIVGGAQALNN
jgi:F-type H+-transporting ATPase subunit gamma